MKDGKEIRHAKQSTKGRGGAVKKAPEGYYTAKDAQTKLGMNPSTFSYYVRKGKINKYVPPLRTEGFYDKKEIDKLATEIALFMHTATEENKTTIVRAAQNDDAQGVVDVLKDLGWRTTTAEQRINWYNINPFIDYIAVLEGKVMGYIHAVPFKPNILEEMMSGKKRSWDIQSQDILPYESGKTYDIYIGIATRQDAPNRTRFGFRLIAGFLAFLEELTQQNIIIDHIYAVSAEADGQKLSKAIGFIQQEPKEGDLFPRFILDLKTSDSQFAQRYRNAIESSRVDQHKV